MAFHTTQQSPNQHTKLLIRPTWTEKEFLSNWSSEKTGSFFNNFGNAKRTPFKGGMGIVWETYLLKGSHVLGGPWKFHWSWKGFIHNINVCTKYPHLLDLESWFQPPEAAVPWVLQCETPCCDQQHSFLVENHKVGGAERQPGIGCSHKSKRAIYDVSTAFRTPN